MYCRHCGKHIADIAKFCQNCGKSVVVIESNTNTNNDQSNFVQASVINSPVTYKDVSLKEKKFNIKNRTWIFAACGVVVLALVIIFIFSGNKGVSGEIEKLLEDDLGESVKITALYYNEEAQGCFVEFTAGGSFDEAAVHLDTEDIDYKSEFEYYSEKAERLRAQTPINETELHKCNQEILNSSYAEWNFTIAVMEADGKTKSNGWEKIK